MNFTLRNNLKECPEGCVFAELMLSKHYDKITRTTEFLIDCKKLNCCPQAKIDAIEVEVVE